MDQRREPLPRRMIPGIRKAASVMALGFDSFKTYEGAAGMLDAYVAAGGNVIDTGWVYGHGVPEGFFGQWQSSRGVREDLHRRSFVAVAFITRAASFTRPTAYSPELAEIKPKTPSRGQKSASYLTHEGRLSPHRAFRPPRAPR